MICINQAFQAGIFAVDKMAVIDQFYKYKCFHKSHRSDNGKKEI